MSRNYRFGLVLALALPLVIGAGCAFAFSYSDGLPGYGNGDGFADPDAQFDAMSGQMSQTYGTPPTDYSDLFSGAASDSQEAVTVIVPRTPSNIGSTR
jgi:hypothetical protein